MSLIVGDARYAQMRFRDCKMAEMKPEDYRELVELLDGRIDELTKPIPSKQILRFAEAIRSATIGDMDSVVTYYQEDYANLLDAQSAVNELLPPILESIRATSIDPETGWRLAAINAGNGDYGSCSICEKPFQHFHESVQVHAFDDHPNAFHGVCRECVRQYAPLRFSERDDVSDWLDKNRKTSEPKEKDRKRERQRIALVDAIREHAYSTGEFGDIVGSASKWADGAFGEWR